MTTPYYSQGFISSIPYNDLNEFYTTTEEDEVITFSDKSLNNLTIEAESTGLYIRIGGSDYCIFIKANTSMSINFQEIKSIQIMGNAGQKIRWFGQYY